MECNQMGTNQVGTNQDERTILLIENQYRQFLKIKKYLNDAGFNVYPLCQDFISFIDLIRVYLNPRYGGIQSGSRRDGAFQEIVAYIGEIQFDVIIIDYILVGCHVAETGIFLAKKLRKQGIDTPIIFLSRERYNQPEIMKALTKDLKPYKWIHKGYDGREILEKEYFEQHVITGIEESLQESIRQILMKIAESNTFKDMRYNGENTEWTDKLYTKIVEKMEIRTPVNRAMRNQVNDFLKNVAIKTSEDFNQLLKELNNGGEQQQ